MTNPSIKNATVPRNSRMEWIALGHGQGPMIARITLVELAVALGATPESLVAAAAAGPLAEPVVVGLVDLPTLAEVGRIALLPDVSGRSVAIARIGAESFVAFSRQLPAGETVTLAASYDRESDRLTIDGGMGAH